MTRAADKYKQRLEAGIWLQPTSEQKQIVALSAELDKMKKKRNDKQRGSKTKEDESGANEGKKRNSKNPKASKKGFPEWKLQPPNPGNSKTKTVKDKRRKRTPLFAFPAKHVVPANIKQTLGFEKQMVKFDTDSEPIAIDSCASYSLTYKRNDFIH